MGRGQGEAPIGCWAAWASSLLQNWRCLPTKGEAGTARLSEVERPGAGHEPSLGADKSSGKTQGAAELEARNLTPRQCPAGARGREGRGWAGRGTGAWHTHTFPQPPADSPPHLVRVSSLAVLTHQNKAIFATRILLHLIKAAARGKTFLWAVVAQMFHKVVPAAV